MVRTVRRAAGVGADVGKVSGRGAQRDPSSVSTGSTTAEVGASTVSTGSTTEEVGASTVSTGSTTEVVGLTTVVRATGRRTGAALRTINRHKTSQATTMAPGIAGDQE